MDDLISRQAVLDCIKTMRNANPSYWNTCDVIDREGIIDLVNDLPSVKLEPKTGHWIDNQTRKDLCNCSECDALSKVYSKYCPKCGAKMT